MAEIKIEAPNSGDVEIVSRWISESGDLALISSLDSDGLSTKMLELWFDASVTSAVVRTDGHPIAFGTVSVEEAPLPSRTAEICHLIVHPKWRRRYNGSHLVLELALKAREMGFSTVAGRVVPHNSVAHAFLSFLRWAPVASGDGWTPGFSWYQRKLQNG